LALVVVVLALQHASEAGDVVMLGGADLHLPPEEVGDALDVSALSGSLENFLEVSERDTATESHYMSMRGDGDADEENDDDGDGIPAPTPAPPPPVPVGNFSDVESPEPFPASAARPFEDNIDKNKQAWAKVGGWSDSAEASIATAKDDLTKAEEYQQQKEQEKKKSEIGCPCEGEPYHYECIDHAGSLAKYFHESAVAAAAEAKATTSAAANATHGPDSEAHHSSYATFKKMLAKYGKLGPNSAFTPRHEEQLKRAKPALKRAEILEEKMMEIAVPEFKKVKEEFPEVFTNGKCPCPEGFTVGDGAALAAKLKTDAVEAATKLHKKVVKMREDPTYWEDINGKVTFARPEDGPTNPDDDQEGDNATSTRDVTLFT